MAVEIEPGRDKLAIPGSAVRQVTDCARGPATQF